MKEYYKTESGKLFCCDNLEYLKQTKENTFDMTVTSPPYDNLRDYKGYSWNFEELAKELYRTTKQGGVVVWVVGDATINGSETGSSFRQALYFMECGFNLHDTMIWHKPNSFNFGSNLCYIQSFEYMFVFSKGKPKSISFIKDRKSNNAGKSFSGKSKGKNGEEIKNHKIKKTELYKKRYNLWKINVGQKEGDHPAIFPERLAYDHIISWSNENDLVFDPFMGSGTTAKMAERSNRRWIGCEISKEYCEITKRRLENERMQLKLNYT